MAVYSVNTNAAQELAVDYLWPRENARRQAAGMSTITRAAYVDGVWDAAIRAAAIKGMNDRNDARIAAYNAASPAVAANADSILGVS